jgi:hypothetical protein
MVLLNQLPCSMRYLQLTEADLTNTPSVVRLMWPAGAPVRSSHACYYVPEDHANIALIACVSDNWVTIPIDSNRLTRTLI